MNIRTCVLMRLWCDFLDSSLRRMQTQPVYRDREDVLSKSSMEPIPLCLLFSLYFFVSSHQGLLCFPSSTAPRFITCRFPLKQFNMANYILQHVFFSLYSFYFYFILSVQGELICYSVICILSCLFHYFCYCCSHPLPCSCAQVLQVLGTAPFALHVISCHIIPFTYHSMSYQSTALDVSKSLIFFISP